MTTAVAVSIATVIDLYSYWAEIGGISVPELSMRILLTNLFVGSIAFWIGLGLRTILKRNAAPAAGTSWTLNENRRHKSRPCEFGREVKLSGNVARPRSHYMVSNKGETSVSKSRSDQKVAVNLASLEISVAELSAIPKRDAAFIASEEMALNDLQFFLLLEIMGKNARRLTDNDVCRQYVTGRNLIILRNLCSRLYEIHESVIAQEKIAKRRKKTILDQEVIAAMTADIAEIRKNHFFSIMEWIRNGVTNHYSANRIAEVLGSFPEVPAELVTEITEATLPIFGKQA